MRLEVIVSSSVLNRSYTAGILGVEGFVITVEADVGPGSPSMTIVGQVSGALNEARERVRAALTHCGQPVPARKQIVNLAPAERREHSRGCDLAIACALLASHEVIGAECLASTMLWGELGLDGTLRPAMGTLVVADTARRQGYHRMIVPEASAPEAAMIPGLEVVAVHNLPGLVASLRGEQPLAVWCGGRSPRLELEARARADLSDVRGLTVPRRAVEIMVAGGHNLLLHGPARGGKTMLARRIAGLLPPLEPEQALEVTKIHSIGRRQIPDGLIAVPPVRMPHYTVSAAGLLGGGSLWPGEVSLAHRGVLFLDKAPEFSRSCLEGLREPLENGAVTIVRDRYALHYPARFQLMAAMNRCPCGYLGHPERVCMENPTAAARCRGRVSGSIIDHMDLVVPVTPLTSDEFAAAGFGESSADVAARIVMARSRQRIRLADTPWTRNADIPSSDKAIERLCPMTEDARRLLVSLVRRRNLSMRAVHRLRRVARTIGDLDDASTDPHAPIDEQAVALAARMVSTGRQRQVPEVGELASVARIG